MIDTGDTVRRKLGGPIEIVACCHPPIAYLIGYPPTPVRLDDIELIESATPEKRHATMVMLAQSSGQGHRPRCARERMGASEGG